MTVIGPGEGARLTALGSTSTTKAGPEATFDTDIIGDRPVP
jgi:hypothetical protein